MDMVWMAHPALPGQLIYEPAAAVIGLQMSGWQITTPPDPPPPETPPEGLTEEEGEGSAETDEKSSSSRRSGRSQTQRGTTDEGKE